MATALKRLSKKERLYLKVGRRVDVGGLMIALQIRRKGRRLSGCRRRRGARLRGLGPGGGREPLVILYQTVILLDGPLAPPDTPPDDGQCAENNGTTHADDYADDGVARLSRHALVLGRIIRVQARRERRLAGRCPGLARAIIPGPRHDIDLRRDGDGARSSLFRFLVRGACAGRLRGRASGARH